MSKAELTRLKRFMQSPAFQSYISGESTTPPRMEGDLFNYTCQFNNVTETFDIHREQVKTGKNQIVRSIPATYSAVDNE